MKIEWEVDDREYDRDEFPESAKYEGQREVSPGFMVHVLTEEIDKVVHFDGVTTVYLPDGERFDLIHSPVWSVIA